MLRYLFANGDLDHDEFRFLISRQPVKAKRNPLILDLPSTPFELRKISDRDSYRNFRFKKEEIFRLIKVLKLPSVVRCRDRTRADSCEALCIVLHRLAFPIRLYSMQHIFRRAQSSLSTIFHTTLRIIYDRNSQCLGFDRVPWLNEERFAAYAAAMSRQFSPLQSCALLVDGTFRPTSRPTYFQESVYSGHKRHHGLNYQGLTAPDGIIVDLDGPYEGRLHDATLMRESNLIVRFTEFTRGFKDRYQIYGDLGYPIRDVLITPYKNIHGRTLTRDQLAFNQAMSSNRIAVEWSFGKTLRLFEDCRWLAHQRILQNAPSTAYVVATLLTNAHTCLRGSQIGNKFGLQPPSLDEYFLCGPLEN